tara:strand:- start:1663 stop:2244 length:582 start_codon:yes stop_codon:yes gene_type:complete
MLSQLEDCLIVDTEKGTQMLEAYVQEVNNREELIQTLKDVMEGHEFKYIALDTIDKVVEWAEKAVCAEYEVASIADLTFGKGYALAREKVMNTINAFRDVCDHLIIVGHRKVARAVIDGKALVEPESLDITGKLKNLIMSDCDAIGYVLREDDKLMISFKADESVEAGSRCEHLRGKCIPFEWDKIYKKEGKK